MITPALVRHFATYNRWQNASIYGAANTLSDEERQRDRGAFWRTIEATLHHLLWGDRLWLSRLGGTEGPRSKSMPETATEGVDWVTLQGFRREQDAAITAWADKVEQAQLDSTLTYVSAANGKQFSQNVGLLTVHMFNHQTHHRGQVHAMLTAAGAKPDDTDLPFMPAEYVV